MPVPHKWKEIISAWAAGETIQQREFPHSPVGDWGPWTVLKDGHAPIRTDMYIEYRVQPKVEPHKWQKEKEAYLAGKKVEFRNTSINSQWHPVDSWLEAHCRRLNPPLWDRDHLEFRIVPVSTSVRENTMDREEMRKAFEEWARSHNWQEEAIAERPMNGALQALHDIYVAGWQAAMAHSCEVLN